VPAEHPLDVRLARRPVDLALPPLLGVLPEPDRPGLWVNVLAGHDGGGDLVEPPLRVDLPVEVAGVLLARVVAVPRPPLPV
jgi:hypothetical protein